MSDQPKGSERMRQLFTEAINEAFGNGNAFAFPSEPIVPQSVAGDALLSAIAALEQRAEKAEQERDKWRECAVAIYDAAMAMRGVMLTKELTKAWQALGDEWDEAVR